MAVLRNKKGFTRKRDWVQNGKKNVPAEWIERLADYYGLSPAERTQLETSAEESRLQYKIIPGNAGTNQRRAALQFTSIMMGSLEIADKVDQV